MKTVIILNGPPRAGKDTFIAMLQKHLLATGIDTSAFSSIDPVRDMLTGAGIDTSKKTLADRKLLATIGNAVEEHRGWRYRWCMTMIFTFFSKRSDGVFFLHVRERPLIEKVRKRLTIEQGYRVARVLLASPRAETVTSNAADAGASTGQYDLLIHNDGTLEDLEETAREFVNQLSCHAQ